MTSCKICIKPFKSWDIPLLIYPQYKNSTANEEMCMSCFYWWQHIKYRSNGDLTPNGERVARINGEAYIVGHEDLSKYDYNFRGYGGAKFLISFFDGTIVTTTNLWSNGPIPQRFRVELPDNAQFISEEPLAA